MTASGSRVSGIGIARRRRCLVQQRQPTSRVLEPRVWHARGLGDFWQHVLVAEGRLDAAVDARLAIWDYAAVALVVEEAGGRCGAPDGGPARPDEQLVSTNGLVHDEVLELLRGPSTASTAAS